ncbi:hypothetical protein EJ05DRAFT_506638 [Pseudovirgaria hyperparasitica]|uniref:S-adenosyl-L-methionine-dependent methyltransferase n=1 Tax=Pseudovirgaria hyperparasitica TaxID=470096 RepID=A0A6A6WLE5_9PEZI|nr:uncharacterized protein EJ05DRAFT_506638 [Pseudovirgaria hyperparasitica]KAF2762993.1 hypothetical protein EJ05DRAFT_506638 [Pseudovirgaria hyperparasitica]
MATATENEAAPVRDNRYGLTRELNDSVRLSMQHWMFTYFFDEYPPQPAPASLVTEEHIKENGNIRIADVGCGNGSVLSNFFSTNCKAIITYTSSAWLLETYRSLPANIRENVLFEGIDIAHDYLPMGDDIPSTFKFSEWDVYTEPPAELIGQFDIVHIRLFVIVVRDNDPCTMIRNAVRLLKPGGYLQWDELEPNTTIVRAPTPGMSTESAQAWITAMLKGMCMSFKTDLNWCSTLASYFEKCGLEPVADVHRECPPEFRRLMTTNALSALENVGRGISDELGKVKGTGLSWSDLCSACLVETSQGVTVTQSLSIVVGRKTIL